MEKEKILLVDDDIDILEFLTFFLQKKGYGSSVTAIPHNFSMTVWNKPTLLVENNVLCYNSRLRGDIHDKQC